VFYPEEGQNGCVAKPPCTFPISSWSISFDDGTLRTNSLGLNVDDRSGGFLGSKQTFLYLDDFMDGKERVERGGDFSRSMSRGIGELAQGVEGQLSSSALSLA
jgi:hypothetical protein